MDAWEVSTYIYIAIALVANVVITVVTLIGGYFDVIYLFKMLRKEIVDITDDGRVVTNHIQNHGKESV